MTPTLEDEVMGNPKTGMEAGGRATLRALDGGGITVGVDSGIPRPYWEKKFETGVLGLTDFHYALGNGQIRSTFAAPGKAKSPGHSGSKTAGRSISTSAGAIVPHHAGLIHVRTER